MEEITNEKNEPKSFNLPAYIVFVATGIYFVVVKDFSQAVIFWGLALVFDPFNVNVTYSKRPRWQQAWLIVHLLITIALFVKMITVP